MDQHRKMLIQRVSSVMEIVDCLLCKNMVTPEMYDEINAQSSSKKQMRLLYRHLSGRAVREEFYNILREKQPHLIDELESGSSQKDLF